ncbi:MAG TPA: glycosyltransferase [Acidimicrobiales bacterium]
MSGTREHAPDQGRVEGVFILGMYDSGAELVQGQLGRMGLRSLGADRKADPLVAFNDRLLEAAGGSRDELPEVAPGEVARILGRFADEARSLFRALIESPGVSGDTTPWVWADPANSFLIPFWAHTLAEPVAVILVHRQPGDVVSSGTSLNLSDARTLDQWDRHNRAALVQCSEWPSMVMSYEALVSKPKDAIFELGEFVERCGLSVAPDAEGAIELVGGLSIDEGTAADQSIVNVQYRVLADVLGQLDGIHVDDHTRPDNSGPLLEAVSSFYGEDYYGTSYDQSGVPYRRGEKLWEDLFARLASSIVATLGPHTVLDMGCATGMLVEALRDRGVDARGIDVSAWAISQVPGSLRPFCKVGSITDELDGRYDLITCFEVLEHLPPSLAAESVANLCRHSDAILFSSTPDDFDEPTHLNVESGGYWARLFFRQGFGRDVDFDASFLAPHAVLFRRGDVNVDTLIEDYERGLWSVTSNMGADLQEVVAMNALLTEQNNELAPLVRETERLREALSDLERRGSAEAQASFEMARQYEVSERRLAQVLRLRDAEIDAIHRTKVFRYTAMLRKVYGRVRRSGEPVQLSAPTSPRAYPFDGTYAGWVEEFDTLDDVTRATIRDRVAGLGHQPVLTMIMPVYNSPPDLLQAAIDSVRAQLYTNWELCIADDCSSDAHVAEILSDYAAMDTRIKVTSRETNGHISVASNTALSTATGEWVGCLDHDDILAEHALALVAAAIADHPEVGIVYSDEDKLDGAGVRHGPYFKPDFDPLLLLGQNYLSHLCLFRRDLVTEAGGYREGYEGSQDWDLTLRVSELVTPEQVVHIPHVLYHWRAHAGSTASGLAAKPYAVDAGRRAVADHLARTGRPARVTPARIGSSGFNRVSWAPPEAEPLVSIIIPTRDGGPVLRRCVDSVMAMTTYTNVEIVVVDNASRGVDTLEYLRAHQDRLIVIRDEQPFNFSAINNAAVRRTSGEIICLLNDDTEVISEDWLTEMVGHISQPGIGAVGAKLYYDDGRVQHGGIVLGIHGVAAYSYRFSGRLSPGYSGRLQLAQHMSAVTAACMAVRREAWDQVGGLDEQNLPGAFHDVDFCLRLRQSGWGIVWTPYAELFHHKPIGRGTDDTEPRAEDLSREFTYMQNRWGPQVLLHDPYYNPNLSLEAGDFSLAGPPRASYR